MAILTDDSGNQLLDGSGNLLTDAGGGGGGGGSGGGGAGGVRPQVNITELDGAIGVLPDGQKILAICGPASAGPLNTPAAFARKADVISNFVDGPIVEEAGFHIETKKQPVLLCRTGNSIAGSCDAIDVTGVTGSSAVTTSVTTAHDDGDIRLTVVAGGTIGTAGITFTWSTDDGRTPSAITALGTASSFAVPGTGVTLAFGAGTLNAGDIVKVRMHAPCWNTTELGAALNALGLNGQWDIVDIVGPVDGGAFDAIETAFGSIKRRMWIANFRMPNAGESEAAYKTAFDAQFGSRSTVVGSMCAGSAEIVSGVNFRRPAVPIRRRVASQLAVASEEIDIAAPELGALSGTNIRDGNGNPKYHDEAANPGLDDSRATTLTTIDTLSGVYVTNCRILSAAGSDFVYAQHRRVMNLAETYLLNYFTFRLSKVIIVSKKTGFILESEAQEIEKGAIKAMSALLTKPKASDVDFQLSRTDPILQNFTLTGQGGVVPLAYPKIINLSIGFRNPQLQIVQV